MYLSLSCTENHTVPKTGLVNYKLNLTNYLSINAQQQWPFSHHVICTDHMSYECWGSNSSNHITVMQRWRTRGPSTTKLTFSSCRQQWCLTLVVFVIKVVLDCIKLLWTDTWLCCSFSHSDLVASSSIISLMQHMSSHRCSLSFETKISYHSLCICTDPCSQWI